MTSEAFVGESRKALVEGLMRVFEDVRDSKRARWVSLEAPSGWGKTRVGREFYARLAATQQDEPHYWPATIEETIKNPDRKAVEPHEFTRPAYARPRFLWWGIACSVRREQGLASAALSKDVWHLLRHVTYMKDQVKGRGSESASARSLAGTVFKEGAAEVATRGLELALGTLVPGVGALGALVHWGVQKTKERSELKQDFASPTSFSGSDSPEPDLVNETAAFLGRVTSAGFPVVMLLEDVHDADELLLELLDKLLPVGGSLMVVTTTWPERVDDADGDISLAGLMESHADRLRRVGHTESAGGEFPEGAGLMMLEDDARREILHGFFPLVEAETARAVVERYESPLALRLFCEWFRGKCGSEGLNDAGALELRASEVHRLPKRVIDFYREIWQQLPVEAQISLAVARLITPTSINAGVAGADDRWSASVLVDVVGSLTYHGAAEVVAEEIGDALGDISNPHSWTRVVDEHLRSFSESPQKDIASRDGRSLLDDSLDSGDDDARTQILTVLARRLMSGDESSANSNAARCTLALHAEGYITDDNLAAQATLTLLEDLADRPREFEERSRLYERFLRLNVAHVTEKVALAVHDYAARAYEDVGKISAAIDICQGVLSDHQHLPELGHISVFDIRGTYAHCLGKSGRVNDAVEVLEVLLADLRRVLGDDHPDTLAERANLAHWLGESGRVNDAVGELEILLADARRVLGDDHLHALGTRANLARWLGESGRVRDAVRALEVLLSDRRRVLGDDHPETLVTHSNLASFLGESGRAKDAVDVYEILLADAERVLGDDHPDTLAYRNSRARWLGESGRVNDAVEALEILLVDQRRVLDEDHPDILDSRANLACWLGERGLLGERPRVNEAVEAYEDLLADQRRVLGEDHPNILRTRAELAHWSARNSVENEESGRLDDAVKKLSDVLVEARRVLGADHPETFAIHSNYALWLGESDEVKEAVKEYEDLLARQQRVLGENHSGTLTTASNLASFREERDRLDGGAEA